MPLSEHSNAQQARQTLADRLREIRQRASLHGRAHARACGWHPAKTSRIENNRTAPSADDIRVWCRACGADDEADDLIAFLRSVEGMFIEWRRITQTGLFSAQQAREAVRARTRRFRCYQS
ncbi:helix-turn-helix domain-containing protein [Jiangella rhizosphaerae]|uniref:helix-turn-helix domain-containing protein n=1 Tax=Jiangella rhizosphaerae TaxID=2293569 RepID=UPI0018F6FC29|nr:helix-turn-helix transcriptional regulator [Jiangella rhizosphaerae]